MRAATSRLWLATLGLLTGACALAGYDFGDYERAPVTTSASAAGTSGSANASTLTTPSIGGEPSGASGRSTAGDAASGTAGEAPANAAGAGGAAGAEPTPFGACEPRSCFELGLACGPADDGCGQPLDCGACFWWFQECVENRCEIPE